ncbi:MAG: hypothetical protein QOJ63_788, partial [Solirubrobacteraceae bacterium]|nr:hypothetical protein [Solirubrobacteraceae bacterium]
MRRLPLHAVPLALVVALLATTGAHAAPGPPLQSKAAATPTTAKAKAKTKP